MIAASFLFALMGVVVKLLTERLPAAQPMVARSLVGLLISWWLVKRAGLRWRGSRPGLLALRGFIGFLALLCNFHALELMPLGEAVVIFQTHPIWTAILAAIFLRERLGLATILGCATALGGVILIAAPLSEVGAEIRHPLGPPLALLASVLSAGAYVTVRALRRSDPPIVVVFWFALIATPASLPGAIASPLLPVGIEWLGLAATGVLVQGAQMLMTRALHREPAGRVAAVGYL
jgi:drug/metabolite transporter (DMT)-like permease